MEYEGAVSRQRKLNSPEFFVHHTKSNGLYRGSYSRERGNLTFSGQKDILYESCRHRVVVTKRGLSLIKVWLFILHSRVPWIA